MHVRVCLCVEWDYSYFVFYRNHFSSEETRNVCVRERFGVFTCLCALICARMSPTNDITHNHHHFHSQWDEKGNIMDKLYKEIVPKRGRQIERETVNPILLLQMSKTHPK